MDVVDRPSRPSFSPWESWISDGRWVLHFRPVRYSRFSKVLEVTMGELMPIGEPPLLKRRKEITREQAIKLWKQKQKQKQKAGWRVCQPQWSPPKPL